MQFIIRFSITAVAIFFYAVFVPFVGPSAMTDTLGKLSVDRFELQVNYYFKG